MFWGLKVWEARNSDSRPPRTAPGSCITAASLILTLPLEPAGVGRWRRLLRIMDSKERTIYVTVGCLTPGKLLLIGACCLLIFLANSVSKAINTAQDVVRSCKAR